jgi:hypothetical protein
MTSPPPLPNVTPDDLDQVVQDYRDAGATSVVTTTQDDGNFTVTATFAKTSTPASANVQNSLRGEPGADSDVIVTHEIGGQTLLDLARQLFGRDPVFWGRYFKRPNDSGSQLYHASIENPVLRARGIRVLPIAQQTSDVGDAESLGRQEAHFNVDALLASFSISALRGQGGEFFMFLDIEPGTDLSEGYYIGWSQELIAYSQSVSGGAFTISPCVYSNRANSAWQTVAAAVGNGGACSALWVAGWFQAGGCITLTDFSSQLAIPHGVHLPAPVMIWQYSNDCHGPHGFDCSQTNPAIDLQSDLLSKLILP